MCPFAMHHASWVLFPLTGATRDGCFLGKTNVCDHRICATHPKDAPAIGQLGRASNCLPLGSPTVVWGRLGWCPAAPMALVLPPALGVPLPQCLLGVPSPRTPPPASGSDLTGPEHLPFQLRCSAVPTFPLSTPQPPDCSEGESLLPVLPMKESCVPAQRQDFLQVRRTTVPRRCPQPPPSLALFYPGDPEEWGCLAAPAWP